MEKSDKGKLLFLKPENKIKIQPPKDIFNSRRCSLSPSDYMELIKTIDVGLEITLPNLLPEQRDILEDSLANMAYRVSSFENPPLPPDLA